MINQPITILLVDDEPDILEILSFQLKKEGYHILRANNGLEAIEIAKKQNPTLVLLDLMMPGIDGVETCAELRTIPSLKNTLIAFLTSRSEDYSYIAGLESGADDYLNKSIKPKLLLSKIKSLLRRIPKNEKLEIQKIGTLSINTEHYEVFDNGKKIDLAKKEFELLVLLTSTPGKVFKRNEIYEKIWGQETIVGDRTIDVHILKLRKKIRNKYITTIKGVGYKFDINEF